MSRQTDPVRVEKYAQKHELYNVPVCKRFKTYVRNQKLNRVVKQAKPNIPRTAPNF